MKDIGYYNGTVGPIDEIMIPMNDRVHFFGDGVYDATFSKHGVVYLVDEHIDRFFNSAKLLQMPPACSKEELKALLMELTGKVDADECFVYWQQTRGTAPRSHAFSDLKPNLWITVSPTSLKDPAERVALTEMEDKRFQYCNIKTLNLIPSCLAAQKAAEENCFECVFHRGDIVTECAHSNVSILKDGSLITHPNDEYILPGIAKKHLILACEALGIPVTERTYTLKELEQADEIIVTSSSNFCMAADRFCGRPVGGKAPELVHKLQQYLMAEMEAYCGV